MCRWPRSSVVVLIGGVLFSGGCATAPPCAESQPVPAPISHPLPAASSSTAALEQKLKLQNKRIAELSMQLKMLKRIDLDWSK